MTNLPKHLEEMRDELAEEISKQFAGCVMSSYHSIQYGFNQAASIMLKDLESMAKALEKADRTIASLQSVYADSFSVQVKNHLPEVRRENQETLKNYREKYGVRDDK